MHVRQALHSHEEREAKRSRASEEDMVVVEMVEQGFREKSSVIPIRVHNVNLDGVDCSQDHHERAQSDFNMRNDRGSTANFSDQTEDMLGPIPKLSHLVS